MKAQSLKRLLSGLLAALMVLTLLPTSAWATTSLSSAPYAEVEYGYSADVSVGTIRYMPQNGDLYDEYWGSWKSQASTECGTCSISMALSYVGINKTPDDILTAGNGETCWDIWGVKWFSTSVSTGMDNYINGNGKYSPVVIQLHNYSGPETSHFVVLAGKESDSVYQVLDPANRSVWNITINGNSAVYSKNGGTIYDTVNIIYQFYNPDAEFYPTSGSCGENLSWTLDDAGTLTISGSGEMEDYTYSDRPSWDDHRDSIQTVVIQQGVTSIGDSAFESCSGLTSISIPNSVTSIGSGAFRGCSGLTRIELPKGIDTISHGMFNNCSALERVDVPEKVKTIEADAFGAYWFGPGCESLKEVTLPKSLTSIEDCAFSGCKNLEDVYYEGSEVQWREIAIEESGNDYLRNATIHYNSLAVPAALECGGRGQKVLHLPLHGWEKL